MDNNKSLDPYIQIIVASLRDVQTLHSEVFTKRACRLTAQKAVKRCAREGISFLTKTLPRLGKALDRALLGELIIDATKLGFKAQLNSKLPRFLGELFNCVFSHDGRILPTPCVQSIKSLRQILFVFYKLELPYDTDQEQRVLEKFIKTDQGLDVWNALFDNITAQLNANDSTLQGVSLEQSRVIRIARLLLAKTFSDFNTADIHPRHGPGAVSTNETLSEKYRWTSVSPRILQTYPLDAFFYASLGHVCDELSRDNSVELRENSAKVLLVPKDSRGPRLISCEPLDFQWIQQGLGRAIVRHVEKHPLTRYSVHFTDQTPNQCGASLGSITGGYATLDLNEASDRVSIGLVRLLFPEPLCSALMNCRSLSTVLPGGQEIKLRKFAPMGSCLCFPIMALSIWAILAAGLPDAVSGGKCIRCVTTSYRGRRPCESCIRDQILVYGDDVIVPTAQAANAIELLESFGLLINRDKSCYQGLFRESCGRDAYAGVNVTPVRIRTVWQNHRCPETYVSYLAYANAMHKLRFYHTYDEIVGRIFRTYGKVPEMSQELPVPSLIEVPEAYRPHRVRVNHFFQKKEWLVTTLRTPKVFQEIGGWNMLLRFFAETGTDSPLGTWESQNVSHADAAFRFASESYDPEEPFSVRMYTKRKTSCLVRKWVSEQSPIQTVAPKGFNSSVATSWDTILDVSL